MDNNDIWIVIGVCIIACLVGIISQLRDDITRMKSTLDRIAQQIGLPDIVTDDVKEELRLLISEGKKVKAIKRCRMVTGLGLKEAQEYVDQLSTQEIE